MEENKLLCRGQKKKKKSNDRPYTHEEISKMLDKADQRERVVILLMASSGIRIGALPRLKTRNLEKVDKYSLYKITGEDNEYITFCTPECRKAIKSYLEYRQRHGERIIDDAPLIREEFNVNDEIHAAKPRHLSIESFRALVRRLGHRSGVIEKRAEVGNNYNNTQVPRTRRPVKETHGLRKAFETSAVTAGMSLLYAEILMGHKSGGLALESYVRPTLTDLLEGNDKMLGYVSIIDALTINEENRLKLENQKIKQRNDILEGERDEVISLQKQLEPVLAL
jgi:integrase